jgi:hypothetical protein
MLIIGLFLVGGGSAAILSTFGTVTGTADVEQAIEVGDSSGETELGFFGASHEGTGDVTAGTVSVDTFTIENNMNRSYSPTFTSYPGETSVQGSGGQTGTQFAWAEEGINTSFVEYYPEAGADFSTYETDVDVSDSSVAEVDADGSEFADGTADKSADEYTSISSALSGSYDKVYVYGGTYNPFIVDPEENVEIIAANSPTEDNSATVEFGAEKGITVKNADPQVDVSIRGLHLKATGSSASAIYVNTAESDSGPGGEITVEDNYFQDTSNDQEVSGHHGMRVDDALQTEIRNNRFEGFFHGVQIAQFASQPVDLHNNTFEDQALDGVFVTAKNKHDAKVDLRMNRFEEIGPESTAEGETYPDADYSAAGFSAAVILGNEDNSLLNVTVSRNVFGSENYRDVLAYQDTDKTDLDSNFFYQGLWTETGNNNLVKADSSYEQVDSVSADSTETVATVNEFALMLDGSQDYSLTTTIQ